MNHLFMKHLILKSIKASLVLLLLSAVTVRAELTRLDRIIAIVDNDVVMSSELEYRVNQISTNAKKSGQKLPPLPKLRQEILDVLILESIQMQIADRAGVRISDADLNDAMERIARNNRLSLAQFRAALEKDGTSYNTTREQVRREMIIQQVQQGSVNRQVQISEQEVKNFLASEEGQALTSPEYRILHSLIPVSEQTDAATKEQAKKYAESAYKKISAGTDYQTAVTSTSDYKISSGDLGWRKAQDIPSLFSDIIVKLAEGETAPPIKSSSGYHLVKLVGKRGEGEMISQTKARHILLKPSAIRDDAATKKEIESIRKRIIDGEDFTNLAREFSEDIGSAVEGGDLGWTSPGQLVGAFQKNMDNTPKNEISPAFRSEFGWHILQVLERREKDVTDDIRSNIVRNFLFERKFNDELQSWLQKIRDEAFVDFK